MFSAILGNKLHKITKVFGKLDPIKTEGSSANSKQLDQPFQGYLSSFETAQAKPFQSHLNNLGMADLIT